MSFRLTTGLALAVLGTAALFAPTAPAMAQGIGIEQGSCTQQTSDVAGCQPGAFDVPAALIPTGRVNAQGLLDKNASEAEDRWGTRVLSERLGLWRNFEEKLWVPLTPSVQDATTGEWGGGDLDANGDGRALTIAGNCLFAGHANSGGGERPMQIFRLADYERDKNPPQLVGEIPVPAPGTDDSIMAGRFFKKADGTETIIVARDVSTDEGGLWVYQIDPANCKVLSESEKFDFAGDMHEFGMLQDPANPLRILIVGTAWSGAGNPDPYRPGKVNPDIRVLAITDEKTGDPLPRAMPLAYFTLQDVGGPLRNERPDETGMFNDGRFANYETALQDDGQPLLDERGLAITYPNALTNRAHQTTWALDGKRVYVAHGTAGFYILNTEAIMSHTNQELVDQKAGCNFDATNVWTDGVIGGEIDPTKYADVRNDCVHMVVNDDPGVIKALNDKDYRRYERLLDKSRFDPTPSEYNSTGVHSAVFVPGRPSLDASNTDHVRAGYAIVTSERGGCPTSHMWMLNIEVEAFPFVTDQFGMPQNDPRDCTKMPKYEYDGVTPRQNFSWQNHNPTVFKDIAFVSWYGHGLRAIDISNPYNLREVGHAAPAPAGVARSYPVFDGGLVYWVDNKTGLHVAKYVGPWAEEVPQEGIWEGNNYGHN